MNVLPIIALIINVKALLLELRALIILNVILEWPVPLNQPSPITQPVTPTKRLVSPVTHPTNVQ